MGLLKTTEEAQACLKINITADIGDFQSYVELAQLQFLKKYIGAELMNDLDVWYNVEPLANNDEFEALLPYVQKVVANFAFQLATPDLDVELTSSGFGVVQNPNLVPASADRVLKFLTNREKIAYMWVEHLLQFLEENEDDYSTWQDSEAYTLAHELFINSAKEFDTYVNIDSSRLLFNQWRQTMNDLELLLIIPGISRELTEEIKQQVIDDNVSANNLVILPLLKRSLANLTAGKMRADNDLYLTGVNYLTEVKKILTAAPNDYPLFRDSTAYIKDRTDYGDYDNSSDSAIYVMG